MKSGEEELLKIFASSVRAVLSGLPVDYERLQEIRLRVQAPLLIQYENKEYYVSRDGQPTQEKNKSYIISKADMKETVEYISNYSLYAYEDELRQGFITVQGGHRVGMAGKVIVEKNEIKTMKYISFINVRLSHQIKGCADNLIPYVTEKNRVRNTLIISPPRCGKTTLLRDLIRQLSDGSDARAGMTVGVVDERSEIAACYMGVPQNDLGIRTDVLDCCPKAKGMLMLIRTMAPQVIAVDEIGGREDMEAIEALRNCGCKLVATVHGSSIEDIRSKPVLRELMQEHAFERYVVLGVTDCAGAITDIYDAQGNSLYHGSGECEKGVGN